MGDMQSRKMAVAIAAALTSLTACGADEPEPAATPQSVQVLYEVEGEEGPTVPTSVTSASITLATPTGTSQQGSVKVPLVNKAGDPGVTVTMSPGDFVYISAQNTGKYSSGDITCRISVDGVTVSENTSSGKFAIATCKGSA